MPVKQGKFTENFKKIPSVLGHCRSFCAHLQSRSLPWLPLCPSSPPFYLILVLSEPALMNWLITVIWPIQALCKVNQYSLAPGQSSTLTDVGR